MKAAAVFVGGAVLFLFAFIACMGVLAANGVFLL
jgi:hypothetical protein